MSERALRFVVEHFSKGRERRLSHLGWCEQRDTRSRNPSSGVNKDEFDLNEWLKQLIEHWQSPVLRRTPISFPGAQQPGTEVRPMKDDDESTYSETVSNESSRQRFMK